MTTTFRKMTHVGEGRITVWSVTSYRKEAVRPSLSRTNKHNRETFSTSDRASFWFLWALAPLWNSKSNPCR